MAGDELQTVAKAGADALFAPVKDIINRIAGPFADELGGILSDRAKVFRYQQSLKPFPKVKAISEECGIEMKSVPLKTLLPILENASLEDDEDLHDRWANLLANAANPSAQFEVLPSFAEILRQLTAPHAILIDSLYETALTQSRAINPAGYSPDVAAVSSVRLGDQWGLLGWSQSLGLILTSASHQTQVDSAIANRTAFLLLLDDLVRLRLLGTGTHAQPNISISSDKAFDSDSVVTLEYYYVTALASQFVTGCRKPKPGKVDSTRTS